MTNDIIEKKLLKVIRDSEIEISRNSEVPICLQEITDISVKIKSNLGKCMVDSKTNTKNEYLNCVKETHNNVNKAYKDIILSDKCIKDGNINRRKALVYLAALWQLGEVEDCLEQKGYKQIANCINKKLGWELPPNISSKNNSKLKHKNKNKGKSKKNKNNII